MNVVVFLEGGVVQQVITDSENVQVVIVDRNTENLPKEDIQTILGEEAYVYNAISEADRNPTLVAEVLKDRK
ncbi:hypothetical protein NSS71_18815 [Niallia sp. FSL W8-0951]|jgi:hypothetical protein|uniref:hypothetical protein n=1 Tax=Niallia TaxID=2837506 RepID=UPI000BA79544|nr:hypothetical protein [Niallia circulans]PAE12747.1 hypothetical protein CHI02_07660 [Niallia circulans]